MKIKTLISLIGVFFVLGVLFAGKHKDKKFEGTNLLTVNGTTVPDTSVSFNSSPNMTFGYAAYDTIDGNDSLAMRLYVDSYIGNFFSTDYWKCEDSLDIAGGDSVPDRWIFTKGSAKSNAKKYRFRIIGIDSNSVDENNFLAIQKHGYEE